MGELTVGELNDTTLVMVDDDADTIFLTRRQIRTDGIVNKFVSEEKPDRLLSTLADLEESGSRKGSFLILLDINMPGYDGFETLNMIRNDPAYSDVPIIMLSASDDEEDMFEALGRGADGYMVKPFKADEFYAALTNVPGIKQKLLQ